MSFQVHLTEVALAVRHLSARDDPAEPADLDLALTAHASAVDLLQQVHGDLAGRARDAAAKPTLTDVETRPLGALYQLLRHHPRQMPIPLTDALSDTPANSDAAAWQGLARHATIAVHHWRQADRASRPAGEDAWPLVADVAAISQHLPRLARRIAGGLVLIGEDSQAERFGTAAVDGLSTAAGVVRALAVEQSAGVRDDEPIMAIRRTVLVIRKPEHLPSGMHRLAYLIRTSSTVSPQEVQLAARTLIRTADAAFAQLSMGERTVTAGLLREHQQLLGRVVTSAPHVTDLGAGDPQVLRQIQEIHHRVREVGRLPGDSVARDVTAAIPSVTGALHAATVRHLESGRWLISNRDPEDSFIWVPAPPLSPPPPVVAALGAASQQAKALGKSLDVPQQHVRIPPAHAVLATPRRDLPERLLPRATAKPRKGR